MMKTTMGLRTATRGWCLAIAASAGLASGCANGVSDESDEPGLGTATSELRNGTLYNGAAVWRGAVGLYIWSPAFNAWNLCSGQVVSRQTILTAGHCVQSATLTSNPGWTYVSVWRQQSATGIVTVLPPMWVTGRYNPDFDGSPESDIGLIIAPSAHPLENITSAYAGLLAKSTPSNVSMWTFGFGHYADGANDVDYLGRYATITPTYDSNNLEYFFQSSGSLPEICDGDSGGPLKSNTSGPLLVYGVTSRADNGSGACRPQARFATTAHNMDWIRGKITGSCLETSTLYSCW